MFPVDELWNVLHGARAVKGVHSNEVFDPIGLEFFQVFLHPVRFKLEDTGGLTQAEKLVGQGIVERNGIDIHVERS